jgi:hypothetical protein
MSASAVRVRTWVRASDEEIRTGLLGYVSVFVGDLIVDCVTLRRTTDGRFALSWPARTDRGGRRHPTVRPVDDEARRAIEREIFGQLAEHVAADANGGGDG